MRSVDIELRIKEENSRFKQSGKNTPLYELKKMEVKKENDYNFFEIDEKNNHLLTELKASMRFWFRAFNPIDISTLWEIEGILFGNSEKNKSPLSIKLREALNEQNGNIRLRLNLYPYVEKKYSSLVGEKNTVAIENVVNKLVEEEKIGNNIEKAYIIKALSIVVNANQGIKWYEKLLELSIILGGVGKKIRTNHGILLLESKEAKESDLKKRLENLIKDVNLTGDGVGIEEVKKLNKTCECGINSNGDKPLEKVISAYTKNEIEYYMFNKEKYKELEKKMKHIDDKEIEECHKYYKLIKKEEKNNDEQMECENLKMKYINLKEESKSKNNIEIEDYYRYKEYKNYKEDKTKHNDDKIYENKKYSYCKKIYVMDSSKDNYEEPEPQDRKFLYTKDKNNSNLTKVVEKRGYDYEYYLGIRSKLYCDYGEKIYSPVAYTSYNYKGIKYSILIILNNICPKEEIFDYLQKGGK